ncbi:MAG TPA: DUF4287 domain-containing protein, partial [Caulobacteraceae bacterium]|nr:DUF4287 domain-containing protein [Caulobacteraceae bacterium]
MAEHLTERQKQWMASLREGLERDTGRTLDEWVAIARTCPETRMMPRLQWFKREHGLGQNRAIHVLNQAFGSSYGWDRPDELIEALWKDPASRAVFETVNAEVGKLDGVVLGARKGYTAWSRTFQFAAVRPLRGGKARLGLAVEPSADPRLEPYKREGWSERLKGALTLASPGDFDAPLRSL